MFALLVTLACGLAPATAATPSPNSCLLPALPTIGNYTSSSGTGVPRPGDGVNRLTALEYSCPPGYFLTEDISICRGNNIWSPKPACKEQCVLYGSDTVKYTCYSEQNKEIPCQPAMPHGSYVNFECKTGHTLSGTQILDEVVCLDGSWSRETPDCETDCGKEENAEVSTFITKAEVAPKDSLPWHVAVYRGTEPTFTYICGGTILRSSLVIGAAHCFFDEENQLPISAQYFRVAANKHYQAWNHQDEPNAPNSEVREIRLHNHYTGDRHHYLNDLALVILETPFEFSNKVGAICFDLAGRQFDRKQLRVRSVGKFAGWGRTEDGQIANELRVLSVPVIGRQACLVEYKKYHSEKYITADKICAGFLNGSTGCDGDSGAGLVFPSVLQDQKTWWLRGVLSIGPTETVGENLRCRSNTYTAYTRVFAVRDWLKRQINELSLKRELFQVTCSLPKSNTVNFACYESDNSPIPCKTKIVDGKPINPSCKKGYVGTGRLAVMTCHQGRWDNPIPKCTPKRRVITVPTKIRDECRLPPKPFKGGYIRMDTDRVTNEKQIRSKNIENGPEIDVSMYVRFGREDTSPLPQSFRENHTLSYYCNQGYDLTVRFDHRSDFCIINNFIFCDVIFKEVIARCLDNKKWSLRPYCSKRCHLPASSSVEFICHVPLSSRAPPCMENDCQKPLSIKMLDDLKLKTDNFDSQIPCELWPLHGVEARPVCKAGHHYEENGRVFTDNNLPPLRCTNGKWSRRILECTPDIVTSTPPPVKKNDFGCPLPKLPDHGLYVVSNYRKPIVAGVIVDRMTLLTYSCHKGYEVTVKYSFCEDDDTWRDSPTCSRSDPPSSKSCILPPFPERGSYVIANDPARTIIPGEKVGHYVVIKYSCNPGYDLSEKTTECQDDNTWRSSPNCTLPCILNPSFTVDFICRNRANYFIGCFPSIPEGTRVDVQCKPGHVVDNHLDFKGVYFNDGKLPNIPKCVPRCGSENAFNNTLRFEGEIVEPSNFPWHVGIYQMSPNPQDNTKSILTQMCGGTILYTHVIVSAAHCFWNPEDGSAISAEYFRIAAGKLFRSWDVEMGNNIVQRREIKEILIPEYYNGMVTNQVADLAIVVLKEVLTFSYSVGAVCYDLTDADFDKSQLSPGSNGKIAVWDSDETGNPSNILKNLKLTVESISSCRMEDQLYDHDKFCAGYRNAERVCPSNGGSGLVINSNDVIGRERWYLRGVVSIVPWRKEDTEHPCQTITYMAYTRVFSLRAWLTEELMKLTD